MIHHISGNLSKTVSTLCLSFLVISCTSPTSSEVSTSSSVTQNSSTSSVSDSSPASKKSASSHGRKNKITVELNDPTATSNPVKSLKGDKLTVGKMMKKLGKVRDDQDVALICEGDYNPQTGILGFDIMNGNQLKQEHSPTPGMTLEELCRRQAKAFANR